jgi:hypothetical protein
MLLPNVLKLSKQIMTNVTNLKLEKEISSINLSFFNVFFDYHKMQCSQIPDNPGFTKIDIAML